MPFSRATQIQSTPSHPILRFFLILSSHLCLDLPGGLFSHASPPNPITHFSPIRATCTVHLTLPDLLTLITADKRGIIKKITGLQDSDSVIAINSCLKKCKMASNFKQKTLSRDLNAVLCTTSRYSYLFLMRSIPLCREHRPAMSGHRVLFQLQQRCEKCEHSFLS